MDVTSHGEVDWYWSWSHQLAVGMRHKLPNAIKNAECNTKKLRVEGCDMEGSALEEEESGQPRSEDEAKGKVAEDSSKSSRQRIAKVLVLKAMDSLNT